MLEAGCLPSCRRSPALSNTYLLRCDIWHGYYAMVWYGMCICMCVCMSVFVGRSVSFLFESPGSLESNSFRRGPSESKSNHFRREPTTKLASTALHSLSSAASPTTLFLRTKVRLLQMAAACRNLGGHQTASFCREVNWLSITGINPSRSGCTSRQLCVGWQGRGGW